jgi:hypothetical protein
MMKPPSTPIAMSPTTINTFFIGPPSCRTAAERLS